MECSEEYEKFRKSSVITASKIWDVIENKEYKEGFFALATVTIYLLWASELSPDEYCQILKSGVEETRKFYKDVLHENE